MSEVKTMHKRGFWEWLNRKGSVSADSALVMSLVLVPLCGAAADAGVAIMTHARLDTALEAGMLYMWSAGGGSALGAQAAVSASWGSRTPAVTTTVSSAACYCLNAGAAAPTGTPVSCAANCNTGQQLASYTTLTLSTSAILPIPLPAVPSPMALSVTAQVRTQ